MNIEQITNNINIIYYKNIIDNLNKNNINYNWLNSYYLNLLKIDNSSEIPVKINTPIDNNTDSETYKKSWSKLNSIHKILKIKEFVNNLKFDLEEDKLELKNKLIELIKNKQLTKKNNVNYDEVNGKIISLLHLKYNNGKYYYD
jgi:hypothetical protein